MTTRDRVGSLVSTNTGVLFVGHGTRVQAGLEQFEVLVNRSEQFLRFHPEWAAIPVDYCYLELHPKDIHAGIEGLAKAGVNRLAVVPILLFSAGHHKEDIPRQLVDAANSIQGVSTYLGNPLGFDKGLIDVAYDRLMESAFGMTFGTGIGALPRDASAAILLVGRGSSDQGATDEFERVAASLRGRLPGVPLFTATMAGLGRTFEEGLEACTSIGLRNIFVLPYLLFHGWLTEEIRKKSVLWVERNPSVRIEMAEPFGTDARISAQFAEQAGVLLRQIEEHPEF